MAKARLVFIGLFGAVILITVVRLLLPYRMPTADAAAPDFNNEPDIENSEQYLSQILAHNLWDKDRTPLNVSIQGNINQSVPEGQLATDIVEEDKAWKLVGVSNTDQESFVMIESSDGVQRYEEGDFLPDGTLLNKVLAYGIQISKSGKNERLYLFGKK